MDSEENLREHRVAPLSHEETLEVLHAILANYEESSNEAFALNRAAEALAFVWRHNVRSEFRSFFARFHDDCSEEQKEKLRDRGWID